MHRRPAILFVLYLQFFYRMKYLFVNFVVQLLSIIYMIKGVLEPGFYRSYTLLKMRSYSIMFYNISYKLFEVSDATEQKLFTIYNLKSTLLVRGSKLRLQYHPCIKTERTEVVCTCNGVNKIKIYLKICSLFRIKPQLLKSVCNIRPLNLLCIIWNLFRIQWGCLVSFKLSCSWEV